MTVSAPPTIARSRRKMDSSGPVLNLCIPETVRAPCCGSLFDTASIE
jgi:hypothetical protein